MIYLLEIKKLSCSVKNTESNILEDFSLSIGDGEVHVIMGPNGTGKSTLSRVIMGDTNYKVSNGNIIFNYLNF